jgi:DNA-binding GntR family transcriptional regulator
MNSLTAKTVFAAAPRKGTRGGAGDHVFTALRDAIVALELQPGQGLDKRDLALQFGVSRAPIYEAFIRLESEGLVDIAPQRGTTVALLKLSDARESMFLRRAMEVEAVRSISRDISGNELERLAQNLRYQHAAIQSADRQGFHRFDLEFHQIIFDALGFARVRLVVEQARLGLDRIRRLLNTPRRQETSFAEHEAIVMALRERNASAAASAMAQHLNSVMTELEVFAKNNPQLFADLHTPQAT